MYCYNCGKEIDDNAKFCHFCDTKIVFQNKAGVSLKKTAEENLDAPSFSGQHNKPAMENENISAEGKGGMPPSANMPKQTFYQTYHFQAKRKREKVDIKLDSEYLHYSNSFSLKDPVKIRVDKITAIETGIQLPLMEFISLVFGIIIMGFIAFVPLNAGIYLSYISTRLLIISVFSIALLAGILWTIKRKITIKYQDGESKGKYVFDSINKKIVDLFLEGMRIHPQFRGTVRIIGFVPLIIVFVFYFISFIVYVVNPNPFASHLLFEGTFRQWEDSQYKMNYKAYFLAHTAWTEEDRTYDQMLVLSGDQFDREIWISEKNCRKISDWNWLYDANPDIPGMENMAIFEGVLTHYTDDRDFNLRDNMFVLIDPVQVPFVDYMKRTGLDDLAYFMAEDEIRDAAEGESGEEEPVVETAKSGLKRDYSDASAQKALAESIQDPDSPTISNNVPAEIKQTETIANTQHAVSLDHKNKRSEDEDFIFPDSNTRYLTYDECLKLDPATLRFAINEIYARRGRIFTSEDLNAYFSGKSWYNGTILAEDFDEAVFNDFEKKNIELLSSLRR